MVRWMDGRKLEEFEKRLKRLKKKFEKVGIRVEGVEKGLMVGWSKQ